MTTSTTSPLRQRMIEDMNARNLCEGTQRGHIRACKRFAAFLKRSPDTAEADDIRRFPAAFDGRGGEYSNPQPDYDRPALLVAGYAQAARSGRRGLSSQGASQPAAHFEPGGSPAADYRGRSGRASGLGLCSHLAMAADFARARWSGSRLATSTALKASSAWCSPKAARTVTSCCQMKCWTSCGNGGRSGRGASMPGFHRWTGWCFPDATQESR